MRHTVASVGVFVVGEGAGKVQSGQPTAWICSCDWRSEICQYVVISEVEISAPMARPTTLKSMIARVLPFPSDMIVVCGLAATTGDDGGLGVLCARSDPTTCSSVAAR